MIKIEYIVYKSTNQTFANTPRTVKNLLRSDDLISAVKSNFKFENVIFNVSVSTIKSNDGKNNYFDVCLTVINEDINDDLAKSITSLHRKITLILSSSFDEPPKVLWNDLDSYYSTKAYPLIKNVENLMRKVLTRLLIVRVGYSWEKESVSQELKGKATKSKGRNVEINYLSALDFIDLTILIFQKYSNTPSQFIFDEIEKAFKSENLARIEDIVPKSNWQRFLSEHIDCDEQVLESKWKRLYEIRCAIAHNTGFSMRDFEECSSLTVFISNVLHNSLNNIKDSESDVLENADDILDKNDRDSSQYNPISEAVKSLLRLQENISRLTTSKTFGDAYDKNIKAIELARIAMRNSFESYQSGTQKPLDVQKEITPVLDASTLQNPYYYLNEFPEGKDVTSSTEDENSKGESITPVDNEPKPKNNSDSKKSSDDKGES